MDNIKIRKCTFCGRMFQSLGTSLCPACIEKLDRDFIVVRDYIYDNRMEHVTVRDIAENTDVSERTVLFLIKEGRLSEKRILTENKLKCATCGEVISSGKYCAKCFSVLKARTEALGGESAPERTAGLREKADKRQVMHTYNEGK